MSPLPAPPPALVQGMGTEPVPPHWLPLAPREVTRLVSRYPGLGPPERATVTWHSSRPMSAGALVRTAVGTVFIKRHDPRVRTVGQLETEHRLADHLRAHGQPVPLVLRTATGTTAVEMGGFAYEVHQRARGLDLYREALSWAPFASLGHASGAGRALARFHLASASFGGGERPPGVLLTSTVVVRDEHPARALSQLCRARPALARALASWPVERDVARHLGPSASERAELLSGLQPWWGHGDWHCSNLTWGSASPRARVVGVIDLGLSNLTFAPHDLAIAIERNCIDWLGLAGPPGRADLAGALALVGGYLSVRPLDERERKALLALLPACHVEHALSEVEYFSTVVTSPREVALAYDGYFLGHLSWFSSVHAQELLGALRSALKS